MKDTLKRFSTTTIVLHWLVALLMIGMIISGLYMTRWEDYDIYPLYKSFGITVLAFALLRIMWRIYNGWQKPVSDYIKWEKVLSRVVQYSLIIATMVIPLSGIAMSYMSGRALEWFEVKLLAINLETGQILARNSDFANMARGLHEWGAYIIIFAIALHIAGALKHHLIDKDRTLRRMLGI